MYEVGLGDTPMRISRKLNGNPYRYGELLAANAHKEIVHVNGTPTFKSLGVGEELIVPYGFSTGVGGVGVGDVGVGFNLFKSIAHVASSAVKDIGKVVTAPVTALAHVTAKIPVIGDITRIVSHVATAPVNVVNSIASGTRLDHVAVNALKDQLAIVHEVAPYAQLVVSFVPGIGTGVSAAIGAGAALAEGQSISEAAKAAIRGALPGGPIAAAGFDAAMKVASGENVAKAALESSRALLPPGPAQTAFDIGLAVATGQKLQAALTKGLLEIAPGQLQSVVAAGEKAIASTPGLATALKSIAPGGATSGFHIAAGLLSHAGINEKSLAAVRSQLPPDVVQGFDAALKTQVPHFAWLKNIVGVPAAVTPAQIKTAAAVVAAEPRKVPQMPEPVRRVAMVQPKPAAPKKPPMMPAPVKRPAAPTPAKPGAPTTVATTAPTAPTTAPGAYAPYPQIGTSGVLAGCGPSIEESTWGPPITGMSPTMKWAGLSAVNGSRGRPRKVAGPDGHTYLFSMRNGELIAQREVA